ncbi:MAG: type II toxin-antitoxin system RelE/ParE family toxin [Crocinitomicaceae bacterium]|nr:type II toxin-antitoxin system RelE/ParE family toxin [Crocinitomicaceae bacterium]
MNKLVLNVSSEALSDLEKIWVYTCEKWSKEQADRYYSLLIEEIQFLQSNYNTGKSAEYISTGYRVSFVKSHILFYKIVDDQKLEIIRILHQSVNIDKWLK